MKVETQMRSVVKSVSWRVFGTLATALVVFLITGKMEVAAIVGGVEFVLKIFIFYIHERFWNSIRAGVTEVQPAVYWLTGLSGAGKSTIAVDLVSRLKTLGHKVETLDGDQIRTIFPTTGFTREEREAHVKRVGHLASILEKNGIFVVVSLISPFRESREFSRSLCKRFVEIHVSTPLEICEQRDVKGLYARARRGEIKDFTGIESPYEMPTSAEITLNTEGLSVSDCVDRILRFKGKKTVKSSFALPILKRRSPIKKSVPLPETLPQKDLASERTEMPKAL